MKFQDSSSPAASRLRSAAIPLGSVSDRALLELIGDARFVLLGEASHGTHEFYAERTRITRLLIEQKGFQAVAAEADWPDAQRVNLFVHSRGDDRSPEEALGGFRRFPAWMWRNTVVLHFISWLMRRNAALPPSAVPAGFYGLDLYSLHASMAAVLEYLQAVDPQAAARARRRYACFDHFGEDPQQYGYSAEFGLQKSCEDEVVAQLIELRKRAGDYAARDGHVAEDDFFTAEQNARVVSNAERYYREMFGSRVSSWNLRDQHMADTLDSLAAHLHRRYGESRIVVWAHNSHLGDARATEMSERGEFNLGQLTRQRHPQETISIGFTTYAGTVTAASQWGGKAERKEVRPALNASYEELFHQAGIGDFLLDLRIDPARHDLLPRRLERAIGVIYLPESERLSHYFYARLAEQFDAVIHCDHTRALQPLERTSAWDTGELPETYPYAV